MLSSITGFFSVSAKKLASYATPSNVLIGANLASAVYLTYSYISDPDRDASQFDKFALNTLTSLLQLGIHYQGKSMLYVTAGANAASLASLTLYNANTPFNNAHAQAAMYLLRCANMMQAGYVMCEKDQEEALSLGYKKMS